MSFDPFHFSYVGELDFNEIARITHQTTKEHGFWPDDPWTRNVGEMISLIVSELSEALEEHREGRPVIWYSYNNNNKPEGILPELADTLIRLYDLLGSGIVGKKELDLNETIMKCLRYVTYRDDLKANSIREVEDLIRENAIAFWHVENVGEALAGITMLIMKGYEAYEKGIVNPPDDYKIESGIGYWYAEHWFAWAVLSIINFAHDASQLDGHGKENLDWYVQQKMAFNAQREHKHGKAY